MAQMGVEPTPISPAPTVPPPSSIRKSPVPDQQQQLQQQHQSSSMSESSSSTTKKQNTLCPFNVKGTCRYGANCMYMHGSSCDLCGEYCLHPTDKKQNKEHRTVSRKLKFGKSIKCTLGLTHSSSIRLNSQFYNICQTLDECILGPKVHL